MDFRNADNPVPFSTWPDDSHRAEPHAHVHLSQTGRRHAHTHRHEDGTEHSHMHAHAGDPDGHEREFGEPEPIDRTHDDGPSRPGKTARPKRDRYSVKKVYIVICRACNEDIGRPVSGEDVTTREEAGELIDAHEEVFHPDDES